MLDCVRNLRTSEIELSKRLPQLECEWLVAQLRTHRGVEVGAVRSVHG